MILKKRREAWLKGETEASDVKQEENNWRKLWRVKVPPKLRTFAWRLARSSLPTGQERARRNMATTATCVICQAGTDSWRHALLDCNMAKSVWALRDDDTTIPLIADETTDAKLWLFGLSNSLGSELFVQVLVTLWAIWWARRKAIHEQEFQIPLSTHMFIQRYIEDLNMLATSKPAAAPFAGVNRLDRWIPPPVGTTKINADGAVSKSANKGAVGVICRDD